MPPTFERPLGPERRPLVLAIFPHSFRRAAASSRALTRRSRAASQPVSTARNIYKGLSRRRILLAARLQGLVLRREVAFGSTRPLGRVKGAGLVREHGGRFLPVVAPSSS